MQSYIKKCYTQVKTKKNHDKNRDSSKIVLRAGLKPATHALEGRCSIHLS